MKYRDLSIQTQREAPNNARTEGFAFLVRAGYLTRENIPTRLGEHTLERLKQVCGDLVPNSDLFDALEKALSVPLIGNPKEAFFALPSGDIELAHCPVCGYTERLEAARIAKWMPVPEEPLPLEKVFTPDCHTIEALAAFLKVPKLQTAKALMYTRPSDNQFIFVVVRGDMQLSEAKLKRLVGEVRPATVDEIEKGGAVPGYASPIGLKNALIVVDEIIPEMQNLVAGANEAGSHFRNTNYGREYSAQIVEDVVQAQAGDPGPYCGDPLQILSALTLASGGECETRNILLALAETHHDPKGLTFPRAAAPFDVYLMHVPGKELDTRAQAEEIYSLLQRQEVSVLFDDRDERAGVKFNDADLIGCPVRITVGEKALKEGMVELKPRREKENRLISLASLEHFKDLVNEL